MAALPKTQRSSSKKRSRNSQPWAKAKKPQLQKLENGKLVPVGMVTPDNPTKKGTKFLAPKKRKQTQAA